MPPRLTSEKLNLREAGRAGFGSLHEWLAAAVGACQHPHAGTLKEEHGNPHDEVRVILRLVRERLPEDNEAIINQN